MRAGNLLLLLLLDPRSGISLDRDVGAVEVEAGKEAGMELVWVWEGVIPCPCPCVEVGAVAVPEAGE